MPCCQGEKIVKWAAEYNLTGLIIGEPTQRSGNTLELVWTNVSGAHVWFNRNECVTNDHLSIRGIPMSEF